jgi:amino acid transporter
MTEFKILFYIVLGIAAFIYFSWFLTSLKINKIESGESGHIFTMHDLIDPKNKHLGFLDLGNHIIYIGLILTIIFILLNAKI